LARAEAAAGALTDATLAVREAPTPGPQSGCHRPLVEQGMMQKTISEDRCARRVELLPHGNELPECE